MKGLTPAAVMALAAGNMENFVAAATPGGIEAQEAAGQQKLVASTMMPKDLLSPREAFEAIGFVFGDPVDDLFVSATLPPGWTRKATDHAMHSDIIDEKGRKRVGVFYKAAFYDRRAHASLFSRYTRSATYGKEWERLAETVCDGDNVIYSEAVPSAPEEGETGYGSPYWHAKEAVARRVDAWLEEHYPNYRDPTAYWND